MSEPVLRERVPADRAALAALLVAQQPVTGYPIREQDDPGAFVVRPGQVAAWVAEVDGVVAGHVALGPVDRELDVAGAWSAHHRVPVDELLCVSALFVGLGHTGRGIGALLFDRAVDHGARLGRPLVLDVLEEPGPALALYENRGWTTVTRVHRDWRPGGVTLAAMVPPGTGALTS